MKKTVYLMQAAVIAAAYLALTMMVAPFAWGPIQFRISEALCVLPALTPAGVPGLAVGCLLFNLLNPEALGPIDIIFGTLATFLAAVITRRIAVRMRPAISDLTVGNLKTWLLPLPPVIINALIVGSYLPFLIPGMARHFSAVILNMATIGLCEAVVTYVIGMPILLIIGRSKALHRYIH